MCLLTMYNTSKAASSLKRRKSYHLQQYRWMTLEDSEVSVFQTQEEKYHLNSLLWKRFKKMESQI